MAKITRTETVTVDFGRGSISTQSGEKNFFVLEINGFYNNKAAMGLQDLRDLRDALNVFLDEVDPEAKNNA